MEMEKTRMQTLMIYFAIATLYRYRKEMVLSSMAGEKSEEFAERNKEIVQRVRENVKSLFEYEFTPAQMNHAIRVFLGPSLSVRTTPVATWEKSKT